MVWKHRTSGIPDAEFQRSEGVPITKEEVRTIQISKARLDDGDTVYDIGCGSGSISVEAALQIGNSGNVYAVDIDPNAVKLTKSNLAKFKIENVTVVNGNAKDEIPKLPQADAIFIGGTGGDTGDIIKACRDKVKHGGRIVVGVILIETLLATIRVFEEIGFDADITQITIAKSKKTSTGTMMLARNPVTVISAAKPVSN